jgi:diacylglycerol kinase family enzyme
MALPWPPSRHLAGTTFALDLGEVNGRVFVNNVSMGLYAEAVRARGGVRSAADKPTGCR